MTTRDRERAEAIAAELRDCGYWKGDLVDELCELAGISPEELARMEEGPDPVEEKAETAAEILGVEVY